MLELVTSQVKNSHHCNTRERHSAWDVFVETIDVQEFWYVHIDALLSSQGV